MRRARCCDIRLSSGALRCKALATQKRLRSTLTAEERELLSQELPPRRLMQETKNNHSTAGTVETEASTRLPGDTFGLTRSRTVFWRPAARPNERPDLFPSSGDPRWQMNIDLLRRVCSTYGITEAMAAQLFKECDGEMNYFVKTLYDRGTVSGVPPFGSYALVALESYAPETYCLASFVLPSFEATRDEGVLEAIHELTLSAAEIPLDTPKSALVDKMQSWTVEDGTPCAEIMSEHGIAVTAITMLPQGEYSAHGFHMLHPLTDLGFPNIGSGATACCLDLRTGIHSRFRFHVEGMADSISEHVLREQLHIGQVDHILRQPYWFSPEYSVEEYIRFKETLLQPSASVFEMRYATMLASNYGLAGYRNIVELEKLRVAQSKYEKTYEDYTNEQQCVTTEGNMQSSSSAQGSTVAGASIHRGSSSVDSATAMHTQVGALQRVMRDSIQRHGDRVFSRFYRNNFH